MKIILISCVKRKNIIEMMAKDLYKGPLFKNSLCVAKTLQSDENKIFILSAKYYLLSLNQIIGPYDMTVKDFTKTQKKEWGNKVITELKKVSNIETDEFIILAGKEYINPISEIKNLEDFLEKKNYFQRTSYLKSICNEQ
jgi:soluble P-type ATPase